ncbi:MAG: Ig-like domain repeat protein, partial [Dehalococcoidia bacterium]
IQLAPASVSPSPSTGTSVTFTATLLNVASPAGTVVTFTVTGANAQTGTGTADASGKAPFTYIGHNPGADTVVASAAPAGSAVQSDPSSVTWVQTSHATSLTYTGNKTADFNDPATLTAVLTDASQNPPVTLSGQSITFTLGTGPGAQGCTVSTDATGTASCTLTPNEAMSTYPLTATFAGDATYQASTTSAQFSVTVEQSALTYIGDTAFVGGGPARLAAVLTGDGAAQLSGRTLSFTLGTGSTAQACSSTTDGSGAAACTIAAVSQPAGPATIVVAFPGDSFYQPASANASATVRHQTAITLTGDQKDDYDDRASLSAALMDTSVNPVAPVPNETLTLTLGAQSCANTTDGSGKVACTPVLNQTPGNYTLGAAFAGDAAYQPSTVSSPFTIGREETVITYTGDTSADFHDTAKLSAVLKDDDGLVISGVLLSFTLGSDSCTGTTDGTAGKASCQIASVVEPVAGYSVAISFIGNSTFLASSGSAVFAVTTEETALKYTGDTIIANGGTAHLSGVLEEDGASPIGGRTVTFTLGSGSSAQTCNGTTNSTGTSTCTIGVVNQPLGPGTVSAAFAGDGDHLPASDNASTLLFAYATASGGSFVIGDGNAALNTAVTYWGAQWSKLNSFKGFADTSSSNPPSCNGTWTTRPGNSSAPPDSVPSYLAVFVSSSISKSGSTISGDIRQIVIIKTDPGYAGNPGHAGTGAVVAVLCHG